ncbi:hypothetical protein CQ019_10735 [Arthrobacter sp. MYb229]|uniref:hypothetical protein n=1 Tax=unclassified Arthrobacter TaxID=235627 RepID=UPI000CFBD2B1|nr:MULTISPECIES: hypothetical protein [unclassified Arthrobacter]PRA02945.1 hypothetical protein CQ019_10735 [Arthrobacter sp. MYb229]PRB49415.1 hypothetical protein CQ013_12215 [Arthrobacter sp. MYb216]
MGFFSRLREQRATNRDLGQGVWRRAHDRFVRSLDRVFQVLDGIEDNDLYNEVVTQANELADLLPQVRQLCIDAQRVTPSDDEHIPQSTSKVHRALTKSANDLAATAQAIAMMRMQAKGGAENNMQPVEHRAQIVKDDISHAAKMLADVS